MKKLFAIEPIDPADGICENDVLVFKATDSHTAPPPFLLNAEDIVGKLSETVDPFTIMGDLYRAVVALLPYAESRAEDIGDDYVESEGEEIPKAEALMLKAQGALMAARRALHRAEAVIDVAEVTDDVDAEYPPHPCPHDPDGVHSVGCGCEFEDEPTPPATLDEDVAEAIRNGALGSEDFEILPTPPSRSADNGWWVEVRVWIRDRDEG